MTNGMTADEFNARERRRGSIVAKLHGYIPFDEGDTEESLQAEYLEITGEAYRSQEEEQADNVQAAKERRQQRIEMQLQAEYDAIQAAKANGFMDCREVRDALGWDKLNPGTGEPYSAMGVAYRWIEDADEEVVYPLAEDGRRITSLTYRSGCWATAFPRILQVKEAYYAALAFASQKSWDDAQKAKDDFDRKKAEDLAALLAQQDADRLARAADRAERYAQLDAARDAEIALLIAESEAEDEPRTIPAARRISIIAALRSYTGPLTKNRLPQRKALNDHAQFKIEGWEKRECWPEAQND